MGGPTRTGLTPLRIRARARARWRSAITALLCATMLFGQLPHVAFAATPSLTLSAACGPAAPGSTTVTATAAGFGASKPVIYELLTPANAVVFGGVQTSLTSGGFTVIFEMQQAATGSYTFRTTEDQNGNRAADAGEPAASAQFSIPCAPAASGDPAPLTPAARLYALMNSFSGTASSIEVLSLATMQTLNTFSLGTRSAESLAVSPDRQRAYVADTTNGAVAVIDLTSGAQVATLAAPAPRDLVLDATGATLYVTTNTKLLAFSTATNAQLRELLPQTTTGRTSPDVLLSVAISPDGATVATIGHDGSDHWVYLVDALTFSLLGRFLLTNPGEPSNCSTDPNDVAFASATRLLLWDSNCDNLYEVDVPSRAQNTARTIRLGRDDGSSFNYNNALTYSAVAGKAFAHTEGGAYGGSLRGHLGVMDTAATTGRGIIGLGGTPFASAITPDGTSHFTAVVRRFETAGAADVLHQYDIATNTFHENVYTFATAGQSARDMKIVADPLRVAYVYSTDSATANAYKTLLDGRGRPTDLIPMTGILTTDLSRYSRIVIGPDTGSGPQWGDAAGQQARYLNGASLPVVGLGYGGSSFFETIGLAIGWQRSWLWTDASTCAGCAGAGVVNARDPLWTAPNPVTIPTDNIVPLYTAFNPFVAVYAPTAPVGVTLVGRQPAATFPGDPTRVYDQAHYTIARQAGRYLLWGYNAGPSAMTTAGADAFLNGLGGLTAPPGSTLSGIARCGDTLLPGAKVTVYSGTAVVATTTADATTAAFRVAGLGAGTYTFTFTLGYTTCGGSFVATAGGDLTGRTITSPIDLHNHAWTAANPIDALATPGIAVTRVEHLYRQGQSAWFKFTVKPGGKVIVTLTGLPANYDLTLYKDIYPYAMALTSPRALLQAGADFAPDAFSPDAFSPDAFSPDAFSPDAFSPDAFSPDAFSPDAYSPDAFSPDAFSPDAYSPDAYSPDAYSPDAFSPDAYSPDAFSPDAYSPDAYSAEAMSPSVTPDAYSGAQTRALIAVSAFNGTSSEGIIRNTWDNDQDFYVRVRGRNGAFSLAAPFTLSVTELTGSCASVSPVTIASTTTASAGSYKTVILTDRSRAPFTGATPTEVATLDARLATYAARPEVAGVIVNVGADARVLAANTQANGSAACPYAKNQVAYAVKDIVNAYWALNPLQYVVLVGSDDGIASFRQPDEAGLANERTFYPPVRDSTASQAILRLGYVLGQDRYGSRIEVSSGDHSFPLPELAVGRLVEKATEITSVLDAYLLTSAGVTPVTTPSLVTGYDFMADAAAAIRVQLELGTGRTADALIESSGLPPTDPSAWTAGQLRELYLGARHDVSFLGAHFSPATLLAADYQTRFLASELAASTLDLRNTILFTIGCHAGFNQVDAHGVTGITREPDFAQAAAMKGMALIANQGYGYGDTDVLEYDERLNLLFSQELRRGTGAVSIGQALVRAKLAYLAATPQMRGIHEKTIVQKTLFGIPQLSVNMPGTRLTSGTDASIVPSAGIVATKPGALVGLRTADASITPALSTHTVSLSNTVTGGLPATVLATYLSGSNGTVVNPAEPILPLETRNVTLGSPAGTVLRGVGFRGGAFTETPNILPLTGAPATEIRGVHAPFVSNVLYPVRFWGVNYLDALHDGGQTRLNVFPAQFISDPAGSSTGRLRQFTGPQSFRLFYSGWTGASANAAAPSVLRVSAVPNAGNVDFAIDVAGLPSAGMQAVWVTYTAVSGPLANQWQSLDLSQVNGSTQWRASLPLGTTAGTDVRFMIQAVNGMGLVTLATNQGAYYVPGPDTVPPAIPKQSTSVTFTATPPTSGTYREKATFTAQLLSGSVPLAGRTLTFGIGSERRQVTTNDQGMATASMALLQIPGGYEVRASFDEAGDLLGSSTAALPFTIAKRETQLTVAPACTPIAVTLRDTSSGLRTLRDQTVIFAATDGTQTYRSYDITDFAGRARFTNALPSGNYTVTATFGKVTDVGGGVTATQTNERYDSSDASTTLAVNPAGTAVTYTGGTLVSAGGSLTASSTITSGRSLTGAVVCYVVHDSGASVALVSGPVTATTGGGTSSVTIAGLPTGVYSITATLVGGDSTQVFTAAAAPVLVAVYDPSAGYVTGGGWINSPAGAYAKDPTLTGRAHFGFVSKYQKGTSVPVGNTEFQFQMAGLRFKSTAYEWLVISGARAQYKGTGTINGTGGYSFLLTAIDGQVNGGGGSDKFRIKIWNGAGTVYDNQMGLSDDGEPTTVIAGGSIVIQK